MSPLHSLGRLSGPKLLQPEQLESRRLTDAELAERAGVSKASALECSYD
jgi:hypothetical protein